MTLYNEIEPYAADWLANLGAAGYIASGIVDRRSIVDLDAGDLAGHTQAHFFAGIGVWSHALRLAGVGDDFPVWTGSCPCQPFSQAGRGAGFDDERHLWPEWFRLIRECRPPLIFGEQVASPDGLAWLDAVSADLEGAGYAVGAFDLCAAGFGAPHLRQRLYFVAYTDDGRIRERLHVRSGRPQRAATDVDRRGADGGVADTNAWRLRPGYRDNNSEDGARGGWFGSGVSGSDSSVGYAASVGRLAGGDIDSIGHRSAVVGTSSHGRMGDTPPSRCARSSNPGSAPCDAEAIAGRSAVEPQRASVEGVVDADGQRLEASGWPIAGFAGRVDERSATRGMGDTSGARGGRDAGSVPRAQAEGDRERFFAGRVADVANATGGDGAERERERERDRRGATAGFWYPCDWIPCHDPQRGIVYRPVEPGAFPLAHGAAARVGRLRAYGNAIVAPQAAEFIRAAIEAIAELG